MTLEQLSPQTVKVQLAPSELAVFLQEPQGYDTDSPQMLRLISFLIAKAELFCEVPFSQGQVTVELFATEEGGLTVYLSCCQAPHSRRREKSHAAQYAGAFAAEDDLRSYCRQLLAADIHLCESSLYRFENHYVLLLRLNGKARNFPQYLLAEYGQPLAVTALLRAKLAEFGECLLEKNAVHQLADAPC